MLCTENLKGQNYRVFKFSRDQRRDSFEETNNATSITKLTQKIIKKNIGKLIQSNDNES